MIYYAKDGMGTRYDPKTNKVHGLRPVSTPSISSDMVRAVNVYRNDQRLKTLMEYPLVN